MRTIACISLVFIFGILVFHPTSALGNKIIGIDLGATIPDGVYCEINEVKLFAQSEEDCEKAGGIVTHTVKTEVKEIGSE